MSWKSKRIIDAQYATATLYTEQGVGHQPLMLGVNFANERIKAYPISHKTLSMCFMSVKNPNYGKNDFHYNGNRAITDRITGLMWMKYDSGYLKAGFRKDVGWSGEKLWIGRQI
uniref:Uncharacterized protein n=1 Tax=candidate division WOR-3 bacterium TaxID=2052148 RepID=A0A7C2P0D0_UNCW3